ncbi:maternal protein tudor [Frankliniella occidentalis]|uniref:Maternal protein tudor n=1 Tax=Frankliniella occidentalis TaxID=133901 RepID=A0A6J1TK15_FRAOC|nr:maternal protein tudor [Frankliniella occidentalis]
MGLLDLYVSHLEKEGCFLKVWGQRDRQSVEGIERLLLHHMEEFEKGMHMPDPAILKPDLLCVCRYKDGSYYRAKLLDVHLSSGLVTCHYLDYGDRHTVPFSSLRVLNNRHQLYRFPAQACSYILSDVIGNWTSELLNRFSDQILYEVVKGLVVKSFGQHSEIQLLKIFLNNSDFVEKLHEMQVACPIPQDRFEVMIWSHFVTASSPLQAFNYPHLNTVNQQWPQMFPPNLQSNVVAAPVVVPPGPCLSTSNKFASVVPSAPAPAVALTGQAGVCPATRLPVDLTKKAAKEPASRFCTIQLQNDSEHKVFVSHVDKGTFTFYVQLAVKSDELEKLVTALNNPSVVLGNLQQPYIPGTMCLAKYSEDDTIYRSIITSIGDDSCNVYFIDYGNCDSVKCHDLFEIPPEFTHLKAMAIPFVLSGLYNSNATDEMLSAFYDKVLEEECVLKVIPPKCDSLMAKQLGELFIDDTNVKELINLEILKKKSHKITNFKNAAFPEPGSKLKVVVSYIKSVECFYVQLSSRSKELENVMSWVAEHCKGSARLDYEAQPGTACCALYTGDDTWYRAMVMATDPLKVLFVDYGNEEEIDLDHLKPASDELVNALVTQAIPCRLHGFKLPCDEALTTKFEDLALENTYTMNVVELDKSVPCVVVRLINDDGADISDLLKPNVAPIANGSIQDSASEHLKQVNGPIQNTDRDRQEERRQPVNGQSNNHSSREYQEKNVHSGNGSKPNFRETQPFYKSDPEAWGLNKGSKSHYGHCDRVNDSRNEENRSSRNSYDSNTNMRRDPSLHQSNESISATPETSIVKSIPKPPALAVGIEHTVEISWFETPARFYVQKRSQEFNTMMKKMQSVYKNQQPVLKPAIGQAVVALYSDGILYRGEVKIEKGGKFGIQYVDYGNKSLVDPSHVYGLQSQFACLPAQAILCELSDVLPLNGQWAKDPELKKLFQGQFTCFVLKAAEVSTVQLLKDKDQDMAGQLQQMGLAVGPAVAMTEVPPVDVVTEDTLPLAPPEVPGVDAQMLIGQIVQAILLSVDQNSILVSFEPKALAEMKDDVANCIKEGLVKLPSHQVSPGTRCLVMDNSSVYKRAVITDSKSTAGVAVTFLDYGGTDEISSSNVFTLPEKIQGTPALGHECVIRNTKYISDLQPFSGQKVTLFVEKYENKRFTGQVLDECGRPFSFAPARELPSLTTILPMAILKQKIVVDVVHASGNTVWLQQKKDVECISELLENLYESCEEVGDSLQTLTCGAVCAAKSEDGNWYRAVIVETNAAPDHVKVQYVDYGNSEDIPINNLKVLHGFFNIPALAIQAELPVTTEDLTLGQTILEMTEDKSFIAYFVKRGTQWLVELLDGKEVFSLKLVLTGRALSMVNNPFPALMSKPKASLGLDQTVSVQLSFAKSMCEFYVHLTSQVDQLEQMQKDLNAMSFCMKKYEAFPNAGSRVMALYEEDQEWYRGEILPDNTVYFIDYGNADKVDLDCLRVLPPAMEEVESLAVKCSLQAPKGKRWSDSAFDSFIEHLESGPFTITVVSIHGSTHSVNVTSSTGVSVADVLAQSSFLEESQSDELEVSCTELHYDRQSLNETKYEGKIVYSNSPSDFYAHLNRDSEIVDKIAVDLERAEEFPDLNDFRRGKICAALFSEDDLWYRAQILDNEAGDVKVRFIDYGNTSQTSRIKDLPQNLREIPPLALHCSLPGPKGLSWSESSISLFNDMIDEEDFVIEILRKEEPFTVDLWQSGENVASKLLSTSGTQASGLDTFVNDMKASLPQESFSSNVPEERHLITSLEPHQSEFVSHPGTEESNFQIVGNPGTEQSPGPTSAGSDISSHYSGQNNLEFIENEDNILKFDIPVDSTSATIGQNLSQREDDSLMVISESEGNIPVITLDDTVEDSGPDVPLDIISVDTEKTAEEKDDSVIDITPSAETIPVITLDDSIEISSPGFILNEAINEERVRELVITQDYVNDIHVDTHDQSSCVADNVSQSDDQNVCLALLGPEIRIPDSSTVDVEINAEDSLHTGPVENETYEGSVSTVSINTENVPVTCSANENLIDYSSETQESCFHANHEESPSISSSTVEPEVSEETCSESRSHDTVEHNVEIISPCAEEKFDTVSETETSVPVKCGIEELVNVSLKNNENFVPEEKNCTLGAEVNSELSSHFNDSKDGKTSEIVVSEKKNVAVISIHQHFEDLSHDQRSQVQAGAYDRSELKYFTCDKENSSEVELQDICVESSVSDTEKGISESISERDGGDIFEKAVETFISALPVISELEESVENRDSCTLKQNTQAKIDEANCVHHKINMRTGDEESIVVVSLSTADTKSCELDVSVNENPEVSLASEEICAESSVSETEKGISELISETMEEDCLEKAGDTIPALPVISELEESVENRDSCALILDTQALMDSLHDKINMRTEDEEPKVVVSLLTYPDWKSCELDVNGISHGQCLASAQDFMSETRHGIPGTKTFIFDDCERHQLTVEIMTSNVDNFGRTSQ